MITEDYVSLETAKLLKEKGFDEPTGFVYSENGELMKLSDFGVRYLLNSECNDYPHWQFPFEGVASIVSAPTIQIAMKWLRDIHGIVIETEWEHLWYAYVKPMTAKPSEEDYHQCTSLKYEEAVESAIKYCLENLI